MIALSTLPGQSAAELPGTTTTYELPCQTRHPELWFADDPEDVARARTLCRGCPIRQECLDGALRRREAEGVWGGEVFWHGVVVAARPRRGRPPKQEPTRSV